MNAKRKKQKTCILLSSISIDVMRTGKSSQEGGNILSVVSANPRTMPKTKNIFVHIEKIYMPHEEEAHCPNC